MRASWKQWAAASLALVVAALLFQRTLAQLPRVPNWDLLGYMGVALEWTEDDPAEVHRRTYALAQEELPPAAFATLVSSDSAVRHRRHQDAAIFVEHIAFYRARVLPSLLMRGLHALGMPLAHTLWWIARASLVLIAVLVALWLARFVAPWQAILAATALAHAPPLLSAARLATPDLLGTLLLCAGVWALAERRRPGWAELALVLCVLTRPDAILVVGILGACWWLAERGGPRSLSTRWVVVLVAACTTAYLAAGLYAGGYGWWPLLHISFVQKELHPASLPTLPDLAVYRGVIADALAELPAAGYFVRGRDVTGSTLVFVYAGFAAVALWVRARLGTPPRLRGHVAVLRALLLAYLLRWFLFPQLWDRFLAPVYVLVPLLALSLAADAARGSDGERDPAGTADQ